MSEDILKCTISDVRPMANMLRSLSFRPVSSELKRTGYDIHSPSPIYALPSADRFLGGE